MDHTSPPAMQCFRSLLLLSAFLTAGVSLKCEICANIGNSCTGKKVTCDARQNACIFTFVENSLQGATFQNIEKGCEFFSACKRGDVYMNLGKNRTFRASTFCCKGAACKKVSPKLPPIQTRPNGKECPACFTMLYNCSDEIVKCVGPEDNCLTMIMNSKIGPQGPLKVRTYAMGCVTKSFCDIFQNNSKYGGLGFNAEQFQCDTASKGPGLPFQVLSSLLLMKFLV